MCADWVLVFGPDRHWLQLVTDRWVRMRWRGRQVLDEVLHRFVEDELELTDLARFLPLLILLTEHLI